MPVSDASHPGAGGEAWEEQPALRCPGSGPAVGAGPTLPACDAGPTLGSGAPNG